MDDREASVMPDSERTPPRLTASGAPTETPIMPTRTLAKKKTTRPAPKPKPANQAAKREARVSAIKFASLYPLYVQKAEKKGRTKEEVDQVIAWLTGYKGASLKRAIDFGIDLETFFAKAPQFNPNAKLIKGVVCGVRVEEIEHPLMQKIRYLDKLIDELAQGKKMESILRQ